MAIEESVTQTKTATLVKPFSPGRGEGRIYRLNPPMQITDWADETTSETEYVWVSAVNAYSGRETYIFACKADGEVTEWGELRGSFQGALDHERALRGAGYEVTA